MVVVAVAILIDNGSNFENIQRISNWHNGKLLSNRKFIKPKTKSHNELIFMNLKNNIFNKRKNIRNLYLFRNKKNIGLTAGLNQAYSFLIRNKYEICYFSSDSSLDAITASTIPNFFASSESIK